MAVIVIGVGLHTTMAVRQQHDKIRNEVGQRMDTVGDKCLRVRKHADDDLECHQYRVKHDTDERRLAGNVTFFDGRIDGSDGHVEKSPDKMATLYPAASENFV